MTEIEILEQTYFDLCTIKRKVKAKNNETGVTETVFKVISENTKCALSKKNTLLSVVKEDGLGKINSTSTLFVSPHIDVREGDIVEVTSMNRTTVYLASRPFHYASHVELILENSERL